LDVYYIRKSTIAVSLKKYTYEIDSELSYGILKGIIFVKI